MFIKDKNTLDALVGMLEYKLEILMDDMPDAPVTDDLESIVIPTIRKLKVPVHYNPDTLPNLMGDYVTAAYENMQE
jgi:hypothetical protein